MNSTDGLVRGTEAVDTGEPIKVPVGDQCLGRVFNLLGEPVDNKPAPAPEAYWPIHRPAPQLRGAAVHHRDPGDRHQGRGPDLPPTQRAARSVCSAVQASARRS